MTIKQLNVEEIARIMQLEDNIEESFPCEKGEWVQWLIDNIDNPRILIIGNVIDNEIKSYLIALDSVVPPLSIQVNILFFYSRADMEQNMAIINMLKDWTKKRGALKIRGICQNIRVYEKYGAEQKAIFGGWDL